ncbi:sulfotransferase family 2 domain-containing protein [Halodurantibacterium flavum]|uniref:Sulfotransferase family 2 domain-containing protein n=1 Tax=Halodurantibacterium flavum TaxID=1382802 RepID=A0ABW4S9I4_9RHOB
MTSFSDFKRLPVEAYCNRLRASGGLWIFHHIPKTAGSSLTRELRIILPPYRNICAEEVPGQAEDRNAQLMQAVEVFLRDSSSTSFRSASGHLRWPHILRIQEGFPNAKLFTFLRDPVDRVVSDYRYAKTPKHPSHEVFQKRFPSLEHYIESPEAQNKMWKFLTGKKDAVSTSVRSVFDSYTFVGLLESIESDFLFFSSINGCPRRMGARANVTKPQTDNVVEMDRSLRERIESLNPRDMELYSTVKQVLDAKRQEMQAQVEARRALWS